MHVCVCVCVCVCVLNNGLVHIINQNKIVFAWAANGNLSFQLKWFSFILFRARLWNLRIMLKNQILPSKICRLPPVSSQKNSLLYAFTFFQWPFLNFSLSRISLTLLTQNFSKIVFMFLSFTFQLFFLFLSTNIHAHTPQHTHHIHRHACAHPQSETFPQTWDFPLADSALNVKKLTWNLKCFKI